MGDYGYGLERLRYVTSHLRRGLRPCTRGIRGLEIRIQALPWWAGTKLKASEETGSGNSKVTCSVTGE